MTEEERAAEYRQRYSRRAAYRAQLRARLSGSPTAYAALLAKVQPLIADQLEDPEDEEGRLAEHANG